MDYTQSGEWEYISQLEGTGRFLDVGAYDGKTFSNTRALAERGWSGVCVEPAAWAFDLLVHDVPPQVECVNALLGAETRLVPFHYSRDAVSTTEEGNMERWKHAVSFSPVYAMQLSVDDLMATFPPPYRLISIDTEGTSLQLLAALRRYLDATEMIVVEDDGYHVDIPGFTQLARTTNNTIFIHD